MIWQAVMYIIYFNTIFSTFSPSEPFWTHFEAHTSKNVIKSIFSYPDLLYVIGKVKVCALRICNCFWAWGPFWTPFEARTSKNDKKSTFSYHDILYIIGKLITWALRICNCFLGLKVILKPFLKLVHQKMTKINFFISWHVIYHWKAECLCFKNL